MRLKKWLEPPKIKSNELPGYEKRVVKIAHNSFLLTCHSLLITFYCLVPYAFPNTIASNAILTYNPYSI